MTDPRPIPGAGAVLYALVALALIVVALVIVAVLTFGR